MSLEHEMQKRGAQEIVREKLAKNQSREYKAFGVSKEELPAQLMVTFRLLNGQAMALPYGYLVNLHFDDAGRVIINFVTHTVTVEGEHLEKLFQRLEVWSVGFVQELEHKDKIEDEPFVKAITIERRNDADETNGEPDTGTTDGEE
jgi:hypothetical protein